MTVPGPWLRLDFAPPGFTAPLVFRDPEEVVSAWSVEEVGPALAAVQVATDAGLWAAGFVAYEAAPAFDPAMAVRPSPGGLPLVWFGLFAAPEPTSDDPDWNVAAEAGTGVGPLPAWSPSTSRARYDAAIAEIRAAIARGDTYQVNHTLRLRGPWPARTRAEDLAHYRRLRRAQQAGYAAYLDLGAHRIVSVSPELFFRRDGTRVTTRPMKGTAPRGRWPEEDAARAAALVASEKDRAENVMVVDLLRNDLGRLAVPGTVEVPQLCALERYPTVWQLTSTVTADVPAATGLPELLGALFPCGSVTGAPKIATMREIATLEDDPRQVYCGTIGLVAPGGAAAFSVAIRTVLVDTATGTAEYGVGGGITWDSRTADEYAELLAKAAVLAAEAPAFALLETLRLEEGRYHLLERHLDRLRGSAGWFGRPDPSVAVSDALDAVARRHAAGRWRVRLLVDEDGSVRTEAHALEPDRSAPVRVLLGREPVSSADVFLQHKTTHRVAYAPGRRQLAEHPGAYDVLLHNERGELTEATTANLVLELDGRLCTPPRTSGLLGGVERAEALATGRIEERVLVPADLGRAGRIWLLNGVRGWVPAEVTQAAG